MIKELPLYFIIFIQTIFIIRFHLEISAVNAYIKPVMILRNITDPVIKPIRQFMPAGIASTITPLLIAVILTIIGLLFLTEFAASIKLIIINSLLLFVKTWVNVIKYGIFAYVILSWIRIPQFQQASYVLHHFFEPLLSPIKKLLPSFGGIDFSPIILLFSLQFIAQLIQRLIYSLA